MAANHKTRVRPGDRWDGVSLTVTRSGVAWASAIVAVTLRRYPRGPVVQVITPDVTPSANSAVIVFHLPGSITSALPIGTTYYGDVVVMVPGALPGDEPVFGPYTLFTWELETADVAQGSDSGYAITWSEPAASFLIELSESGVQGPVGPQGPQGPQGLQGPVGPSSSTVWASLTDAATVTWAVDATKSEQKARVTLSGNRTLSITGATDGMSGIVRVTQDGTGGRTLALPGNSKVISGGSGAITLSPAASAVDILAWEYDGTNFYWTVGRNFT